MGKVIGFGFKRLVGKDTAAKALEARTYEHIAFADALKVLCNIVASKWRGALTAEGVTYELVRAAAEYGIPEGWVVDFIMEANSLQPQLDKVEDGKYRYLLQWAGTDFFRKRDPDIWVKIVQREIEASPDVPFVLTDVRFPNEADMVHAVGGLVVRIDRAMDRDSAADTHSSESAMSLYEGFNCRVFNTGSVEDLQAKVRLIDDYYEAFVFCRNAVIVLPS